MMHLCAILGTVVLIFVPRPGVRGSQLSLRGEKGGARHHLQRREPSQVGREIAEDGGNS